MWETRRGVNLAFCSRPCWSGGMVCLMHVRPLSDFHDAVQCLRRCIGWTMVIDPSVSKWGRKKYLYTCWGWENIPQPEHQHGEGCTLQKTLWRDSGCTTMHNLFGDFLPWECYVLSIAKLLAQSDRSLDEVTSFSGEGKETFHGKHVQTILEDDRPLTHKLHCLPQMTCSLVW